MKFIAHRGYRDKKLKENSIEAFKKAIDSDFFSGFEFDIRECSNHKFVINHNAFVKDDLIKFKNSKYLINKYNLPTLEEVLKLETDKIFLIEIKDSHIDYKRFIKIINKHQNKNIYIMSFHNKVIEALKKYKIKAKLGVLNYILNSESDYDYDFICLLNSLTTKDLIKCYKEKNIEVIMYGIIDPDHDLFFKDVYYILDYPIKNKD